jgi:hypothetical protein
MCYCNACLVLKRKRVTALILSLSPQLPVWQALYLVGNRECQFLRYTYYKKHYSAMNYGSTTPKFTTSNIKVHHQHSELVLSTSHCSNLSLLMSYHHVIIQPPSWSSRQTFLRKFPQQSPYVFHVSTIQGTHPAHCSLLDFSPITILKICKKFQVPGFVIS